MVHWLGLQAFTAKGAGSFPAWGTKILKAMWQGTKKKVEKRTTDYDPNKNITKRKNFFKFLNVY